MFNMARRSDLLNHQRHCEEENRRNFDEVKQLIARLEDRMYVCIGEVKTDIASKHRENQDAIKTLWKAFLGSMGALIAFLAWAAENGGLAGIIHKAF